MTEVLFKTTKLECSQFSLVIRQHADYRIWVLKMAALLKHSEIWMNDM